MTAGSTALDIEVTALDELDLDAVPPCEIIFVNRVTGHQFECGKPSVIRMHMACGRCSRSSTRFMCRQCYDDLLSSRLSCWYCFTKTGTKLMVGTYRES